MARHDSHYRGTETSQNYRETYQSRPALVLTLILVFVATGFAQNQNKRNDRPQTNSDATRVTVNKEADRTQYGWEFAQPEFVVNHIVLEHDALGRGKVSFERRNESEPVVETIAISPARSRELKGSGGR